MCGIIAVVRRPSSRATPQLASLIEELAPVEVLLSTATDHPEVAPLRQAAAALSRADVALRGVPGVSALCGSAALRDELELRLSGFARQVQALERALDDGGVADNLEELNAAVVQVKDALWALRRDRLPTADRVRELAGADPSAAALAAYTSIQQALSAVDRLEVRGRDSAGLHVLVRGHGLDLDSPSLAAALAARSSDPLFTSGSVRRSGESLGFVYKAAAEIGELGDNTRVLREAIGSDALLRLAVSGDGAEAVVLGHTRWASIGIISQPNAHPLNSDELDSAAGPYVTAVLNGDVDNFADLKATDALDIAAEITTDAKVIPTLTSRQLAAGVDPVEAFRVTVNRLEGSVAIAAQSAQQPADLLLALRGSGQALYVGLADDAFIVASEPYGLVEETATYLRMDGETPGDPDNPGSRGQVIRLRGEQAGGLSGVQRWSYDGSELPVRESELATAQITTRDIDRGESPHFLLKEISEAPGSFRKTLRGKLVDDGRGGLTVRLPDDAVPPPVRDRLRDGSIRRLYVVGQGTAAIAGHSLAAAVALLAPDAPFQVQPLLATELSGFDLASDMSDTLVVAISQSGTTTDTNRTVDLVRGRGAAVVSIVNRRNSDLTDKSDGVLYTSDGRDVEMSVASTKAFYSQIAACFLLGAAIADELGSEPPADRQELLAGLRSLPALMERTLALRPQLADAAQRFAPSRRYWAVVGNGANRIAAHEVRIKLSELCYKSIACDSTEDKKHIDLSSEPLILVCAAGLSGSTADDVAKEVAIFRAHKAAPIVITSEGDERFGAALQAVSVPSTHPGLAFVLSAMAGHLFGYEAALAIDAQALPLREARAAIESTVSTTHATDGDAMLAALAASLEAPAGRFFDGLRNGDYDGHLEASTAVRLSSLLRFALGYVALEAYQVEHGKVGTPSVLVEDLIDVLTRGIEELTRPIDAIKHQAKTVTVGISRSDETLLQVPLVRQVLAAGAARDRLTYSSLRTLAALEPLVSEVIGYTRYSIDGRVDVEGGASAVVVDRGGLGRELRSRTEQSPVLRGTKRRVAAERQVLLARGRHDGRTVLIVPEVKDNQATGLTLLHVVLAESVPVNVLRSALVGYRGRYQALRDAVTETEPAFRDDLLTDVPLVELMTDPIYGLADRWRS